MRRRVPMGNGGMAYDLVTKELTPVATETAARREPVDRPRASRAV
jgi:hypothetical protein